jgi:hypothetical protein
MTGGLSATRDGSVESVVVWDEQLTRGTAMIVGFYGQSLRVGCGPHDGDRSGPAGARGSELALLVGGAARRRAPGAREGEEIEAVRRTLGPSTVLAGFYSAGGIATRGQACGCEVGDRAMTLTTFSER